MIFKNQLYRLATGTAFALLMLIPAKRTAAQNATSGASQRANLTLSNAIELSFTNGGGTQTASMNTISDMINGVELADQDLKVRSNQRFKVDVAPATTNFVYTGSAILNNIISAGTGLRIKVSNNNTGGNAGGGWLALGSVLFPTTILNNCDPGENQTFSIRYKTLGGGTIAPGTYSINIIFTATQL